MKKDLWQLNVEQLQRLYDKEKQELERRLLAGAAWEDVSDLRERMGRLSNVLYKKHNPTHFDHPAEKARRKQQ